MLRRASPLAIALVAACAPSPEPVAPQPPPPAPPIASAAAAPAPAASRYPDAPRGDVVDDHLGMQVADPYRWLEDLDSPQTRAWVAAENTLTDAYFADVPGKEALHARVAALTNVEQFGLPRRRGGRAFWAYNSGKDQQFILYTARSIDDKGAVLVDPNQISPDGSLAWAGWSASRDGKRVAYGLSIGGGDWEKWRVRDVATRKDLPDELEGLKYYPPAFTRDGSGVYYSRFPAPAPGKELSETDHDCKVYFHALGTSVAKDRVVYERPDQPTWQFEPHVSTDGRFLVVVIGDGQVGDRMQEQIVTLDLQKPGSEPVAVVDRFEADFVYLGSRGSTLYLQTTLGAPKKRLVAVDARSAARDWKEIVPEGPNAIDSAGLAGSQILVTTLADAHSMVTAYDLTGKRLRDVALPGIGTAYGFGGLPEDREVFYGFESFTTPASIYRYDLATGKSTLFRTAKVPIDPATLETTQVFYSGKDGTKIPMFITGKRGAAHDPTTPTLLYGYGGFGLSLTPFFWPAMAAWVDAGGIFAQANIRGGGEYGEAWHQAATKTKKQVSYDDFIAGGEWLSASGYTSHDHFGAFGVSGGGQMMGVLLTQRPDLFGAIATLAGVHDLVRFPLFGQGAGWQGDLGSPDVPAELASLLAISPLHNVKAGTHYPPTFVQTADHDVRVAPLHSYKFAAALQWAQAGDAPIVLRVETTSGHGGGTTRSAQVDQETELLGFFAKNLGLGAK